MFQEQFPIFQYSYHAGEHNLKLISQFNPFLFYLQDMPPKKRIRNQSAPHPKDPLGEHVSHIEFRAAFTTISQSVATQNEQPAVVPANPVANSVATRIRDFTQMNPPSFFGSKPDKDPQEFVDQVQKVIDIMGVTSSESTELAAYQLQYVVHTWFKQWLA